MIYTKERPLLNVHNLNVTYGDTVIIKDINFTEYDINRPGQTQGQIIAFLGRSGRGKSTLFRALTGLVEPTEGHVIIPDFTSSDFKAAKSVVEGEMGFVDQKYTLMRHKTVEEILMFASRKSKLTTKQQQNKVDHYLNDWGLWPVRKRYRHELSGGQRQRVAIIAQLLCSGMFIVMDEPFSGLDPTNIEDVKRYFDMILKENEFNTIIFSTHDIDLACEIAQSIYIIGYPTINGAKQHYGTIVNHYDLREMKIAWQPYGQAHMDLSKQIKQDLFNS